MNSLESFSYTFTFTHKWVFGGFCGTFKNIVVFLPYMQSYYTVSFSFIRWGRVFYVKSVLQLLALALGKEMGWVKLLETTPKPGPGPHPPRPEARLGAPPHPAVSTTRGRCAGRGTCSPQSLSGSPAEGDPLQGGIKIFNQPPPNNNKIKN